jgi:hypothetical protein
MPSAACLFTRNVLLQTINRPSRIDSGTTRIHLGVHGTSNYLGSVAGEHVIADHSLRATPVWRAQPAVASTDSSI